VSYLKLLMPVTLLVILTACGTTPHVGPSAASICAVWEPQPFYWPERCEATPGTGDCATLQDIGRVTVKNNAARTSVCTPR